MVGSTADFLCGVSDRSDWMAWETDNTMTAPMTCEPPPESRDVRWHWVRWMDEDPRPVSWDGCAWETEVLRRKLLPAVAGEMDYRYIAPIPMPETVP